jgi:hypothetical protein
VSWLEYECTRALSSKLESSKHNYERNLKENLNRVHSSYKFYKEQYGVKQIHLSTQKINWSAATTFTGRMESYGHIDRFRENFPPVITSVTVF